MAQVFHRRQFMLFDSHAHITDRRFDKDRDEVIKRAFSCGVKWIVNPGTDFESSVEAVELAERYEGVYAGVGVHPHDAKTLDENLLGLIQSLAQKSCVKAIGEIGLDFYYDNSPRDVQKHWFARQIQMAKEVGKPIIIHDRDAHEDVFSILDKEKAFENGVLMHCFSASAEMAKNYVKKGAYISLGGPVTYKNARKAVEVAKFVDLDRLLIETDSPYLTPTPHRGKRNESAYVELVARKIAHIRNVSFETIAKATTENAKRFFRI